MNSGLSKLKALAEDILDMYSENQKALIEHGIMCLGMTHKDLKKDVSRLKREIEKAYNAARS